MRHVLRLAACSALLLAGHALAQATSPPTPPATAPQPQDPATTASPACEPSKDAARQGDATTRAFNQNSCRSNTSKRTLNANAPPQAAEESADSPPKRGD